MPATDDAMAYLQQAAESERAIIRQMETMGGMGGFIAQRKQKLAAYLIVFRDLSEVEEVVLTEADASEG